MSGNPGGKTSAVYTGVQAERNWHKALTGFSQVGDEKGTTSHDLHSTYRYAGGRNNVTLNSPQMYGPTTKPGQTFHEQQKIRTQDDHLEYGPNPTTLHMRHEGK